MYLAQGNTLGIGAPPMYTPCKGKSMFIFPYATNLLPFQGEYNGSFVTQGVALGYVLTAPLGRFVVVG